MQRKYEPRDLILIHRPEILAHFTRARMTRPQIAPMTLDKSFRQALMRAYFPSDLRLLDLDLLKRDIRRLIGKDVLLRDKRLVQSDQIQQVATFESL